MPARVNSQQNLDRAVKESKNTELLKLAKKLSGTKKNASLKIDMMQANQTNVENNSKI